jgi:mRNA interferase HigB
VRVISRKKLLEAAATHADLEGSLDAWYRITKGAAWKNFSDLRRTFSTADVYKNCTIFNVKGNRYRLIAWVNYSTQKLFIRRILTHAEYDEQDWKADCA